MKGLVMLTPNGGRGIIMPKSFNEESVLRNKENESTKQTNGEWR
jgi:hypothetical protein